jgi:hypothetical protein
LKRLGQLIVVIGIGASSNAALSPLTFAPLAATDSFSLGEALLFALIATIIGGGGGLCVGLLVSLGRFGALGGGAVALVPVTLLVIFYIFVFGSPGRYTYLSHESIILVILFGFPTIAGGFIAGLVNRRLSSARK